MAARRGVFCSHTGHEPAAPYFAAGAVKVIGYDLAVLGNAGLDSLEKWKLESSVEPPTRIAAPRESRENRRMYDAKMLKAGVYLRASRYYRLDGTRIK
jgi:hypothetical protein